jgi:UDP-N-acetylmuramoyl-tripeptide--D-alanyl-D-alanine ligase
VDDLLEGLRAAATPRATLLVKGSRFMRMERVVEGLTGETGEAH